VNLSKPQVGSLTAALRAEALIRYADGERIKRNGVPASTFLQLYAGQPPWEIGRPQPVVVDLEREGQFQGAVLDVGCGRGENAFFLASRGHTVCAIDFVEEVVIEARLESERRGLAVDFSVMDATDLDQVGWTFDTVLDSATFHTFSRHQRLRYVAALREITRPGARMHLVCLGDRETRPGGPPRITRDEIREAFAVGWTVTDIKEQPYTAANFPGGARSWAANITRV
jgi:SAM-dependent methyltransferase